MDMQHAVVRPCVCAQACIPYTVIHCQFIVIVFFHSTPYVSKSYSHSTARAKLRYYRFNLVISLDIYAELRKKLLFLLIFVYLSTIECQSFPMVPVREHCVIMHHSAADLGGLNF